MKTLHFELTVSPRLLALIGGGEFSFGQTREIDELLLQELPADRRTVAFLPTASGSAEYAQHLGAYFRRIDPSVETINVPIYRGRDNRRQKNLALIASAGMIYLGGGVTNNLLAALRDSPAEEALREAAAGGAIVAAIGAAASSFGIHTRDMRGGGPLPGLGWLPHAIVETGFEPENDTTLRRFMSLPDVQIGVGIPVGNALMIRADGSAEIAGPAQVAVFRKA
jgi:peptidase E